MNYIIWAYAVIAFFVILFILKKLGDYKDFQRRF
jgi:hypothetical protein